MKFKLADLVFAITVIAIVIVMILPLPTFLMDTLLIINIALALIILLLSLYVEDPLQFSVFPTLLLIITLFRLTLNLSSTRLILGNGGDAGNVIRTFGNFVIGGNLVVGVITFVIILIIQFLVITKGAERVAEVTARFTLDAMPGKQMAIDADLNSGIIDEAQARERRDKIQQEADFNGAMDGAAKFIKGDAIAGVIITIINIVGGLIIGIVTMEREIGEVVNIFVLATVGDGLVSQIPALLISTASGIIVTRSGSNGTFGTQVAGQLFGQPYVLFITGALVFLLSFVPGMPKLPMWLIAVLMFAVGGIMYTKITKVPEVPQEAIEEQAAAEKRRPENVETLLHVEPIELELGFGNLPMVDISQGGDLFDRIVMIRRQCALDLGIIVPAIRVRDSIKLAPNAYAIKIKGVEIARGEVMADHLLAISTGEDAEEIPGIPTVDPAFGVPALWIPKSDRALAEISGYSTTDPPSIIATHFTEVIKRHGHELLNRQQVQSLIENLKRHEPAHVDEIVPKMFSLGEVQKLLANFLIEDIPIKDMGTIVETLGDYGGLTRDTELLTEYVRTALKRAISKRFMPEEQAHVITLDATLEQLIVENTKQSEHGSYLSIEPAQLHSIFDKLRLLVEKIGSSGYRPIILTSPLVRRQFRKIAEQLSPDLVVLSFNEVEPSVEISSEGVVRL
ncbi:MAG: flagellar biosynthesis protein FlhA [Clostridiales bacterium]|nr:flagellar biosynthesis protein FlhA [Clostridiales bacterium]